MVCKYVAKYSNGCCIDMKNFNIIYIVYIFNKYYIHIFITLLLAVALTFCALSAKTFQLDLFTEPMQGPRYNVFMIQTLSSFAKVSYGMQKNTYLNSSIVEF